MNGYLCRGIYFGGFIFLSKALDFIEFIFWDFYRLFKSIELG